MEEHRERYFSFAFRTAAEAITVQVGKKGWDNKMKNNSVRNSKKFRTLLALLLSVVMLPFGCLGESSATATVGIESLFDDDEYYPWLYCDDEEEGAVSDEVLALMNLLFLHEYNSSIALWCRQEAEKLPEGSDSRKEYENFAVILQSPLPGRPTEEESKAFSEQYLSNISSQLQEDAVNYYRRCVATEPSITADLFEIAEHIGTEMFGVEFRLKSAGETSGGVCRIADKITEYYDTAAAAGAPITYREAAEMVTDIIRYTQLGTPDTLVYNYLYTKTLLEAKGYKFIKVKNTWQTYTVKAPYRGVNVKVQSPYDGIIFELQFHTAESLVVKMAEHVTYEVVRDPRTPVEEKAKLQKKSYELYDRLTEPEAVELVR